MDMIWPKTWTASLFFFYYFLTYLFPGSFPWWPVAAWLFTVRQCHWNAENVRPHKPKVWEQCKIFLLEESQVSKKKTLHHIVSSPLSRRLPCLYASPVVFSPLHPPAPPSPLNREVSIELTCKRHTSGTEDQLHQSTPCKGHRSTTQGAGTLFPSLFAFEWCCTSCATSLFFRFPYKIEILIYNLLWSNLSLQLERDNISFSTLSLLILGLILLTLFILSLLVELEGIKEVWQHAAL